MRALLILPGMLFAWSALAEAPAACDTQRDTGEMEACALYHQGEAEAELGLVLADLRSRFPDTSALLDATQADWSTYRDSHCRYQAYPYGGAPGSESRLDDIACKTTLTRLRADQLRDLLAR